MSYQILLVDSDPDFRRQSKQWLQEAGFGVIEAENENQANEFVRNKKFDLAVIDVVLENSDGGFTMSYHLKRNYPNMPVVLLSSTVGDFGIDFSIDTVSERSWIKADILLHKPIRSEQLVYSVNRLLTAVSS
ncbi:MAG: response regulator [Planctomycetaceae bacterium]|jgi:DNA-binding NtrC family response regulator|nr:response regulator [Planctomycetaceae bacterium]